VVDIDAVVHPRLECSSVLIEVDGSEEPRHPFGVGGGEAPYRVDHHSDQARGDYTAVRVFDNRPEDRDESGRVAPSRAAATVERQPRITPGGIADVRWWAYCSDTMARVAQITRDLPNECESPVLCGGLRPEACERSRAEGFDVAAVVFRRLFGRSRLPPLIDQPAERIRGAEIGARTRESVLEATEDPFLPGRAADQMDCVNGPLLPDPIHPADSLLEPHRIPRQLEIHDDPTRSVEIEPLAGRVGG
jgi:hypothetical protein